MLPRRLRIISKILAISALSTCLPVKAQEKNGWQYDSLGSKSDATEPDAQRVYEILVKMLDRWNAHDIERHLEVYWKSPELLVVIDSEQFNGWQQLHDSYLNGYPDRSAMGVHRARSNPSEATQAGSRTRSNLVDHKFPD